MLQPYTMAMAALLGALAVLKEFPTIAVIESHIRAEYMV